MEYVELKDTRIPKIGLGTWELQGQECQNAVRLALDLGYRNIDTAQMYRNENDVGQAIQTSGVNREEIFLTTKILSSNLNPDDVVRTTVESLRKLRTEYVDLLLIHWPNPRVALSKTIAAMDQLRAEGKTRYIGVSNFSVAQMKETMQACEDIILTNQVKYHPYQDQSEILRFCIENNMILTAYSPLARGRVTSDPVLADIGKSYGKSASQVALRWLISQTNVMAIPKSGSETHLAENLNIFDFELSDSDLQQIMRLHGGLSDRIRSFF